MALQTCSGTNKARLNSSAWRPRNAAVAGSSIAASMQLDALWQLQFRAWAASNNAQHHSPYGPSTVWPPKPSAGGTVKVRRPPTAMPAMPACMDEWSTAWTATIND